MVLVGAPGQVISGAITNGADRAIDGKARVHLSLSAYLTQHACVPCQPCLSRFGHDA